MMCGNPGFVDMRRSVCVEDGLALGSFEKMSNTCQLGLAMLCKQFLALVGF